MGCHHLWCAQTIPLPYYSGTDVASVDSLLGFSICCAGSLCVFVAVTKGQASRCRLTTRSSEQRLAVGSVPCLRPSSPASVAELESVRRFDPCPTKPSSSTRARPPSRPMVRCSSVRAATRAAPIGPGSSVSPPTIPILRCGVRSGQRSGPVRRRRLGFPASSFPPSAQSSYGSIPLPHPAPNNALQRTEAGGGFFLNFVSCLASLCR